MTGDAGGFGAVVGPTASWILPPNDTSEPVVLLIQARLPGGAEVRLLGPDDRSLAPEIGTLRVLPVCDTFYLLEIPGGPPGSWRLVLQAPAGGDGTSFAAAAGRLASGKPFLERFTELREAVRKQLSRKMI